MRDRPNRLSANAKEGGLRDDGEARSSLHRLLHGGIGRVLDRNVEDLERPHRLWIAVLSKLGLAGRIAAARMSSRSGRPEPPFNDPAFELPFFPALLDGVRNEPLDFVVTVGPNVDPATLGRPPDNVHVERCVPQSLLFPRVSLVICHGGFGTVVAAIENGVPLIVVPFGADQHLNAAAVERLQLGIVLDEEAVEPATVRDAIQRVLGDATYRHSAERLRETARALPPIETAIELIESLA